MSANTQTRNLELAGILIRGLTANIPADGTAGYPIGCLYIATDGTTVATTVFVNVGTETSCNFDALT